MGRRKQTKFEKAVGTKASSKTHRDQCQNPGMEGSSQIKKEDGIKPVKATVLTETQVRQEYMKGAIIDPSDLKTQWWDKPIDASKLPTYPPNEKSKDAGSS